jgi:hypothetical protein
MQLHVYQSIWAMEGLPWRSSSPWTREQQIDAIAQAGYDGVSVSFTDVRAAREICALAIEHGLRIQASYFPTTVQGLATVYEAIEAVGREHVDHVNLQPNVRPHTVGECLPYLLGWQRLAADAGVPTYVETHRDRMTTDLFFTLQLLEALPSLLSSRGRWTRPTRSSSIASCAVPAHTTAVWHHASRSRSRRRFPTTGSGWRCSHAGGSGAFATFGPTPTLERC